MRIPLVAFALVLATPAWAQTVPSLPPQILPGAPLVSKDVAKLDYPYTGGSGFYVGINTMGGVAQSSATASGLFATSLATGNLTASGGAVGGTVGYTSGSTRFWWALEGSGDWQNVSASANMPNATTSVASRWSSEQVAKVGGTLQTNFLSTLNPLGLNFPTFELPTTPNGISVAASPHPYIMGGVKEFGISGNFNTAGGTTWGIAPLLGAGTIASILDTTGKPTGLVLDLFAEVVFANKGMSISNVFGTTGVPMTNAALTMNNQYWAGAKVLY